LSPLYILSHPLFNRDTRLVAEEAAGFGEVGTGEGHVFGAGRLEFDLGFLTGRFFDELDESQHLHRLVVAKIDRLAGNARSG
jgi:hypothetical protein